MGKQGKSTATPSEPARSGKATSRTGAGPAAGDANLRRSALPRDEGWDELANFVVTFERRQARPDAPVERRITAHRMENDGITAKWTGDAQLALGAWMSDQVPGWSVAVAVAAAEPAAARALAQIAPAAEPVPSTASADNARTPSVAVPTPATTASPSSLEFLALKVQGAEGQPSAQAGLPFEVEAWLQAAPRDAGELPSGACAVQFFCRNASTAQGERLGIVSAVAVGGGHRYRAVFQCDGLPAGTYRIESAASMRNAREVFAYRRGPLLEVV
jgi:hypothetical protein